MIEFEHIPHPRIAQRRTQKPVKVADQHPTGSAYARFNTKVALGVTKFVGSMTCAWVFLALSLISLPAAIASHNVITIVSWVAQTCLQLVLLSVIMVGQNVQAGAADARAEQTYQDAEAVLHEAAQIQEHLLAQDQELTGHRQQLEELIAKTAALTGDRTTPPVSPAAPAEPPGAAEAGP